MHQIAKTNNRALASFAERFSIEPEVMEHTLKTTVFKQSGNQAVTNEQMVMLMIVAEQHNLNPFTKEIYAFPDKQGGVVPVVGVDGWSRLINSNPHFNGMEFRRSETMLLVDDGAKTCPEWMEIIIYRDDRKHPIVVREYLDEVYRPAFKDRNSGYSKPGPWQTHTKRMLRHKCMIQGARIAFGFAGIFDEDEAERIIEARDTDITDIDYTVNNSEKEEPVSRVAAVKSKVIKKDTANEGAELGLTEKDSKALIGKINKCRSLVALEKLLEDCIPFGVTEYAEPLRAAFKKKKQALEGSNTKKTS